jgi:two-component system KDP operon response regulator KdpE
VTTILVIDDEPQILRALGAALRSQGYEVVTASNGEDGLTAAAAGRPELIVLDLGLPDLDGVEVLKRLRSWSAVPVIVLSVREAQTDKVSALDVGADDYLSKPFGIEELLARMRATLRRTAPAGGGDPLLRFDDLVVDRERRTITRDGRPVHLTPTEYSLLEAMVSQPGKLLTHAWLLDRVWGPGYHDESHYLRVFIRQLRRKLGDQAASPRLIATEPGIGYRWLLEPDTTDDG